MAAGAQVRFGDWQVSKVGTKFVDCGFDFSELGRGRGSGIIGYKGGRFRGLINR